MSDIVAIEDDMICAGGVEGQDSCQVSDSETLHYQTGKMQVFYVNLDLLPLHHFDDFGIIRPF